MLTFSENPRTCSACGVCLFPNYMEGCWWHHIKNGCKYEDKEADFGWKDDAMLGPFKEER